MDDDKFKEILQDCGISAKGISILDGLIEKSNVKLLENAMNFGNEDIENLKAVKQCMEQYSEEISESFYSRIADIEGIKEKININKELTEQLKLSNIYYLKSLFEFNYDASYYKNRISAGLAHNISGISPSLYIAIYGYHNNLVSSFIFKCCQKKGLNLINTLKTVTSIQKKLAIDTTFAIESYYKKSLDDYYKIEQESLGRLMAIAEYKDADTGNHIKRVSNYAKVIAKNLGMNELYQERIFYSSPMHDIGKVGIPDEIILKQGKLNEQEFKIMKTHCDIGYKILKDSNSTVLKDGSIIAKSHHENFNGEGYPLGLRGEEIPLGGRICKIADVFDALVSKRCYKPALPVKKAVEIMEKEMQPGKSFDPECFYAFLKGFDEIMDIKKTIDGTTD